jgi:hypothetical protein
LNQENQGSNKKIRILKKLSIKEEMKKNAFKFKSHEEALEKEIEIQSQKSHYQRMLDFMEIQKRVWGSNIIGIRESGVFVKKKMDE